MHQQEQQAEQMEASGERNTTSGTNTTTREAAPERKETFEPARSDGVLTKPGDSCGTASTNQSSYHFEDMECIEKDEDAHHISVETEVDSTRCNRLCCSRRKILIALAVITILGVLSAILYPKLLPGLTKKKAIKELEVSKETARILKMLNAFVSVLAVVSNKNIEKAIERAYDDENVVSEDFDLGWKKTTDSSSAEKYGWTSLEIVNKDSDARDISSTLFVEELRLTDSFSVETIPRDDVFGTNEGIAEVTAFLRNSKYLPMQDNIHYFESEESQQDVVEDLGLLPLGWDEGYLMPRATHEWEEMVSDEALSRIFWYGIGSVLVMGPELSELYEDEELVGFEIDMDLSSFPVREDFEPYGFRIQFDLDQKVTSIYDAAQDQLVSPSDGKEWEEAKFQVKQTVITVVSVREHLTWSHLLASNTVTRASVVHLPPNHPIRRLLSVFTFRSNRGVSDAQLLLTPEGGLFHRITAFEYPGLLNLFDYGRESCDIFRPFRDANVGAGILALAEEGKFPYYKEGLEYYMLVHQLVNEWLVEAGEAAEDAYALAFYEELVASTKGLRYEVPPYSKENMVDELAQLIWVVTAHHEIVGDVAEYTQKPDYMGFRVVKEGRVETDTEAFLIGAFLTGQTALLMPKLIGEFPNYFGQGDGTPEWEVRVWDNFQRDLLAQSAAVQAADAARIAAGLPEFKLMDSSRFECSASV